MRHYTGCCDAERDARAMGYRNAREADADNWGNPVVNVKVCETCKCEYTNVGCLLDGKRYCNSKCIHLTTATNPLD